MKIITKESILKAQMEESARKLVQRELATNEAIDFVNGYSEELNAEFGKGEWELHISSTWDTGSSLRTDALHTSEATGLSLDGVIIANSYETTYRRKYFFKEGMIEENKLVRTCYAVSIEEGEIVLTQLGNAHPYSQLPTN